MKMTIFLFCFVCLACERQIANRELALPKVNIRAHSARSDLRYQFIKDSLCVNLYIPDLSDTYLRFLFTRYTRGSTRCDSLEGYAVAYPNTDPEIMTDKWGNAQPYVLYEAFGSIPMQFYLNLLDSSTLRLRISNSSPKGIQEEYELLQVGPYGN